MNRWLYTLSQIVPIHEFNGVAGGGTELYTLSQIVPIHEFNGVAGGETEQDVSISRRGVRKRAGGKSDTCRSSH